MKMVSRVERGAFAPFDLKKIRKFDKKTDKIHLAESTFRLACEYFDASAFLLQRKTHLMPVILTNISFSCELFLKALLYGYNIDFENVHGLNNLFQKLPDAEKDYIENNIAIENKEIEFKLCLKEQNDAFVVYRYMNEAKAITANPKFLFAFAHILKFVYESCVEESNKSQK